MSRIGRILYPLLLGLVLAQSPAVAGIDNVTAAATAFLEAQGFEVTQVERTLLGRIRIEARRGQLSREMVIDRTTGEILRDNIESTAPGGLPSRSIFDVLGGETVGRSGDEGGGEGGDDGGGDDGGGDDGGGDDGGGDDGGGDDGGGDDGGGDDGGGDDSGGDDSGGDDSGGDDSGGDDSGGDDGGDD